MSCSRVLAADHKRKCKFKKTGDGFNRFSRFEWALRTFRVSGTLRNAGFIAPWVGEDGGRLIRNCGG